MMTKSSDDEVELCNMFRNLLRHGLIERQDLIQGGHTDTAASLMLSRPAFSIEQRDKEEVQGILRGSSSSRAARHGGDTAGRTKKTLRDTPAPCEDEEAAALTVEECKRLKPRRICPPHGHVDDFEDDDNCGAPAVVVRTSAGAWSNADEEAILLAFRSEGALLVEQRKKKHDDEQDEDEEDDSSYYYRLRMTEGEM